MRARATGVVAAVLLVAVSGLVPAAGVGPVAADEPAELRLNQVQVIGTHNSYHLEQPPEVLEFFELFVPDAALLAYSHTPLDTQLESEAVRQMELDIYADGQGGFDVFHIDVIDPLTSCDRLVDCLGAIESWSDANPGHMPLMILIEAKDSDDFPLPPAPPEFTPGVFRDLDAVIESVFEPEQLLVPDEVRGGHATLEEAILEDGWPTIEEARGKVMFALDNADEREDYLDGNENLADRVLFTNSAPGLPDAGFVKMNDPTGANTAEIQQLVAQGYVVRTRADEPVTQAKAGDYSQLEAALASGAQWVSTDYPVPGRAERFGTGYVARVPGGYPARCNPVNAPAGCTPQQIEYLPRPPRVEELALQLTRGTSVAFSLPATDPNGDLLGFELTGLPEHGELSGTAPDLTFLADEDYEGPDSLAFEVSDGVTGSTEGEVTFEVVGPERDGAAVELGGAQPLSLDLETTADEVTLMRDDSGIVALSADLSAGPNRLRVSAVRLLGPLALAIARAETSTGPRSFFVIALLADQGDRAGLTGMAIETTALPWAAAPVAISLRDEVG